MIAAATGDTASKYVARRETPLFIPENCTQCMECYTAQSWNLSLRAKLGCVAGVVIAWPG